MRQWIYAAATALSLGAFGAVTPAQALPVHSGLAMPSDVEQAQFIFGGRNYCFYPNGWNGPGFYWCGYAFRRGLGWGGGAGWHGWDHHRPHMRRPPPRSHMGRPGPRPQQFQFRQAPRPQVNRAAPRPHAGPRPGGGGHGPRR